MRVSPWVGTRVIREGGGGGGSVGGIRTREWSQCTEREREREREGGREGGR